MKTYGSSWTMSDRPTPADLYARPKYWSLCRSRLCKTCGSCKRKLSIVTEFITFVIDQICYIPHWCNFCLSRSWINFITSISTVNNTLTFQKLFGPRLFIHYSNNILADKISWNLQTKILYEFATFITNFSILTSSEMPCSVEFSFWNLISPYQRVLLHLSNFSCVVSNQNFSGVNQSVLCRVLTLFS